MTLLDQTDQKHDEAHQRLRNDFREFEQRTDDALKLLRDEMVTNRSKLSELALTPIDATKLVLSPKIVASIVFVILGIAASFWASTSGLRSDVEKILTRMEFEQRVTDANAKLVAADSASINRTLEANSKEFKESIAAITRRQELQQLQISELKESILILTQGRK